MTSFLTQAVGAVKRVLMLRLHYCWTHQSEKCAFKQPGCSVYAQRFDWVHYIFDMFVTLNHYGNAAFFCSNTTWKQHRWCIRNGGGKQFLLISTLYVECFTCGSQNVEVCCIVGLSQTIVRPPCFLTLARDTTPYWTIYCDEVSCWSIYFFFATIRVLDFDIQLCC